MFSKECGANLYVYGPSLGETCGGGMYLIFMSLIDAFLRNTCVVSDAAGRILPRAYPDPEYDFIVIGSGPGGSTVAGRLAEVKQWKILLVEAGDDEPVGTQVPSFFYNFFNTSIDWAFKTEPEPVGCQGFIQKRCTWPRGKVLGGCSVINGMMYMRGTPNDYKRWVETGNPEWSYDKVLPFFKSFEDFKDIDIDDPSYYGQGGPLTIERFRYQSPLAWDILKGGQQIGFNISRSLSGKYFNGFSVSQMMSRGGVRLSLAKAFIRPQKNNPYLHVMLNTTATRILIGSKKNQTYAKGVEISYIGQTFQVKAKKEIIVSAGAIQTPQILLLSGIGSQEILNSVGISQLHNLPAVGKGLQNHVSFKLLMSIENNNLNMLNVKTLLEYLSSQNGPMSSTGLAQVTARIHSNYSTFDDPDIQFYFFGLDAKCSATGAAIESEQLPELSVSPTYLHTQSKGYIGLTSNDPFIPPKMVANYLTVEQDIKGLVAGIRLAQKLIASPILQQYGIKLKNTTYGPCDEQYKWNSDEYWICAVKYETAPENHQGSSCKMGPKSNLESCVNQQLQLYGIENIRIMDASVFPKLVSGNPQATIIMVAERGAHFIKEKYLNITHHK